MKRRHFARARRVSIIYIIITAIWIIASDRLLAWLAPDSARQLTLQTIKGLLFITVTAGVMYVLLRRELDVQGRMLVALRNSEAQWRSLVENAPDMIGTVNRQGEILFINHALANLSPEQAQGTSIYDYVPPDYHPTVRDAITSVFEAGQPTSCEIAARGPDGALVWYAAHLGPVKHNEHIHAAILITRDITARKQAEMEHRQLLNMVRSIIEATPLAIIHLDPDGVVQSWNAAAERLFGWPADEAVGRVLPYVPLEKLEEFAQLRARVMQGESFHGVEAQRRRKDGQEITISISTAPMRDPQGNIIGIIAAVDDITERKRAEDRLREREATFRLLFESNPHPMWVYDLETLEFLEVNDAAVSHYGYSRDEFLSMNLTDIRPPEDVARLLDDIQQRRSALQRSGNWRHRLKDGRIIDVEITSHTLDFAGRKAVLVVAQDITERKQWERKLQESEEKYRQIVETAHEGIWVINAENETVFVNARMAEMLGYTVDEMLGQPLFAFLDTEGEAVVKAEIERRKRGLRGQYELTFRRKDGTRLWTFISANPLVDAQGQYQGSQAMITDVSDLKQTQHAEREQRILAEALAQTARALISAVDLDEVMHTILENIALVVPHDAANIMLLDGAQAPVKYWRGYSPEHARLFSEFILSVPDTPNLQHMVETGEPFLAPHTAHYAGWAHVPLTAWVKSYIAAPIRSHGDVIGFLNVDSGTPGHFTEAHAQRLQIFADQASIAIEHAQLYEQVQQHAEELEQRVIERTAELNHTKERVEAILNSSTDVIVLCRMDGTIEQVNPAFLATFHCAPGEVFNWPLIRLVEPDARPVLEQAFASVIETRDAKRLEVPVDCSKGVSFEADIVLSPIVDHERNLLGVVCSLRDISRRKQMEAHLRQMLEREMELSELKSRYVSMAAHDLRNPLAVIQSAVSIIENYRDRLDQERLQAKFDTIRTGIQTMVAMLDDVLTLGQAESGTLTFEPAPLDVVAFCRQIVSETRQAVGETSRIEFSVSGTCDTASVDEKLLRYILGNLLSNALKYSPDDSIVTLAVHCEPDQLTFRVQDQGIGIPAEDQARLFEAFHRASNVGQVSGTGLGLAIVKQSVELHGGTITYESEESTGTTFTVTLPIVSLEGVNGAA